MTFYGSGETFESNLEYLEVFFFAESRERCFIAAGAVVGDEFGNR